MEKLGSKGIIFVCSVVTLICVTLITTSIVSINNMYAENAISSDTIDIYFPINKEKSYIEINPRSGEVLFALSQTSGPTNTEYKISIRHSNKSSYSTVESIIINENDTYLGIYDLVNNSSAKNKYVIRIEKLNNLEEVTNISLSWYIE